MPLRHPSAEDAGQPSRALRAHVLDADLIDIKAIVATLVRFSPAIVGSALVGGIVAAIVLLGADPTYRARAQVFLDDRDNSVIEIENVVGETIFGDRMILSETVVLKSRAVLTEVARRLDLARYPEFNPALRTAGPVTRAKRWLRALVSSDDDAGDTSPREPEAIAAAALADHVKITQLGLSYVIAIDVTSASASRAAAIANTLAQTYLDQQVADKVRAGESAVAWLGERVSDLRDQAIEAETAVSSLRANLRGAWQQSPDSIQRQLDELSTLLVRAQGEQTEAEARASRFEQLVAAGDYGAAMEIASSPAMTGLEEARADAVRQLVGIETRAAEGTAVSARVTELRALTERVADGLAREAVAVVEGLGAIADIARERNDALRVQVTRLERLMGEQSTQLIGLRELEREAEALQAVHAQFLGRLKEARERVSYQDPDARILSPASPPGSPSSPSRLLLVAMAMIGGGLLAALGIILWDARRDVLRTEEDVLRTLGLPALGLLPAPVDAKAVAKMLDQISADPHGALAGQIARMASSIVAQCARGDGPGNGVRRIVVTSALPDEGAAGLACLLAQATARIGSPARVLGLGPEAKAVFANLSGEGETADDPPRPFTTQLLSTTEGWEPRDNGRGSSEIVILAAPPILATHEALALADEADWVVLAVRWSSTPRQAAAAAMADLAEGDVGVSIVLTDAAPRRQALYDYNGRLGVVRALDRHARRRAAMG